MKNTFLIKTLAIILLTVILSAALTAIVFNYYGREAFSNIKAEELVPRAKHIAGITADFISGYIGSRDYERAVASEYRIWDAAVYIFNSRGELIVQPVNADNDGNISALKKYVESVLMGASVFEPATNGDTGVIIGEPAVSHYGDVVASVFLVKPLMEVTAALSTLTLALLISMLTVTTVMVVPAYIGSRNLTRPLRQMNAVANAMAHGDFSIRAEDCGNDEMAQLGKSLNFLSAELSKTISDLVFERNRLRAVIDGMREGIIAFDAGGGIIQHNPSALRLLGGQETDDLAELIARYGIDALTCQLSEQMHTEKEIHVYDTVLRVSLTALQEPSGRVEGGVMLIQDVTESILLEQTRREYVANVSHELRTPIASIRGLADALNDGMIENESDKARYYGYILRETLRLSRLIDDLMELSRLQSGALVIVKKRTNISELLCDVIDRFSGIAAEHEMQLVLNAPDGLYAHTSADRAEQVLIVLIDNAIKHSIIGGQITVNVYEKEHNLLISVENAGYIPQADLKNVFERFFKVDKSHSGGGTGLGLSIAREIIVLIDERIWARCENGIVTFSFTLSKDG
ncbi:MAG: histidine kinase dimerization/phospho-acceptor domain-containing protein [Clostridia bacterium]